MTGFSLSIIGSAADEAEYDAFLARRPKATIYHSLRYRDLVHRIVGGRCEYAIARRNGAIVACLPVMSLQGLYGEVLNSLPFFGSTCGVLADDADAALTMSAWLRDRTAQSGVIATTVIENPFTSEFGIQQVDATTLADERIAQWSPLDDGPTGILARIDSSARRNIRKAEEAGVRIRVDNDALDFLESTHRENMVAIGGLAKPRAFFDALPTTMRPDHDYRLYVAEHSGSRVAGLLLLYYREYVEYIMPVTTPGLRELQPTAPIIYRAMCDASEEGRRIWNWGGTWLTQTGVYRFKKKWGAIERPYHFSIALNDPAVLQRTAAELAAAYPFYYVVPFAKLQASTGH